MPSWAAWCHWTFVAPRTSQFGSKYRLNRKNPLFPQCQFSLNHRCYVSTFTHFARTIHLLYVAISRSPSQRSGLITFEQLFQSSSCFHSWVKWIPRILMESISGSICLAFECQIAVTWIILHDLFRYSFNNLWKEFSSLSFSLLVNQYCILAIEKYY